MLTERQYSYPVWRVRTGQALLLFMIGLGCVMLVFGSGPWWAYPPLMAFFAGAAWWTLYAFPRRKATETAEGIRTWDLGFPVKRLIRWSDIDHFERISSPFGQLVEAVHPSGRSTSIMGLDAAAVTRWEGDESGQTDDIVAELNRRLALWRSQIDSE